MDDALIQKQLNRQVLSQKKGLDRLLRERETARALGREWDLPIGSRAIAEVVEKMRKPILSAQAQARKKIVTGFTTGQRLSGWETLIQTLDAEVLAYITARCCFSATHKIQRDNFSNTFTRLSIKSGHVGYYVWLEARYYAMEGAEKELANSTGIYNRLKRLQRNG